MVPNSGAFEIAQHYQQQYLASLKALNQGSTSAQVLGKLLESLPPLLQTSSVLHIRVLLHLLNLDELNIRTLDGDDSSGFVSRFLDLQGLENGVLPFNPGHAFH